MKIEKSESIKFQDFLRKDFNFYIKNNVYIHIA